MPRLLAREPRRLPVVSIVLLGFRSGYGQSESEGKALAGCQGHSAVMMPVVLLILLVVMVIMVMMMDGSGQNGRTRRLLDGCSA